MRTLTLLGATGSIGTSTLKVLRAHPQEFRLIAAAAGRDAQKLFEIALEFRPERVSLCDERSAEELRGKIKEAGLHCEVLSGPHAAAELSGAPDTDIVLCAIVGAAGLESALCAVRAGHTVALANKEALVMSGRLFFDETKKYRAQVLPVDSEHSAIFQCLPEECQRSIGFCDLKKAGVRRLVLTGSGGPFRTLPLEELKNVTAAQAVAHPVWRMGPKISTDSATMMNKGLEFIEARYLFNAKDSDIEILIHPQSLVHSMVSYIDGALLAQSGRPDMCTPIARALAYPGRIASTVEPLDLTSCPTMSFERPDFKRYPCLKLAIEASRSGQGMTTALNAANEVAVDAFLKGAVSYPDIARIVAAVLGRFGEPSVYSLDEILAADARARALAREELKKI
ncbi:MAG: 1-deoxy-D-xylulose-5-phosphate reductoisomerase [Succinivibrio sp.]|jgi:1-deoxy-D-xylulose-5-phosphate reductoisomerase|nr:1-deoxy-D-xylulose-5-phosphate reductoisomerase [Succinivibrio sp.]